ncbi:hypothetical protein SUDANB95_03325 [Actinosynnema sp. ALI-1.44]
MEEVLRLQAEDVDEEELACTHVLTTSSRGSICA